MAIVASWHSSPQKSANPIHSKVPQNHPNVGIYGLHGVYGNLRRSALSFGRRFSIVGDIGGDRAPHGAPASIDQDPTGVVNAHTLSLFFLRAFYSWAPLGCW